MSTYALQSYMSSDGFRMGKYRKRENLRSPQGADSDVTPGFLPSLATVYTAPDGMHFIVCLVSVS